MGILDLLPNNPFTKKREESEYFFSLNISSDKVTGSVWGIEGKKIHVISTSVRKYHDDEDIIEAANYSLDEALADFLPEPEKILFGVPDSWLQDDELKPENLRLLKKMVKELGVVPMAYVSTTHAICHLLQKQTGAPVSSILIDISNPLTISVVNSGKILTTTSHKRSENLPQDIEKALQSISTVEVLPSKLIIYGDDNLNKYKEELLSFSWMSSGLPFLHLPKIEVLDKNFALKAVCFAGSIEIKPHLNFTASDVVVDSLDLERKNLARPMKDETTSNLSNVGFISGDIEDQEAAGELLDEEDNLTYSSNDQKMPLKTNLPSHESSRLGALLAMIKTPFQSITHSAEDSRHPLVALITNKFVFIPVILLVGLLAAFVFLPKAKITVFIDLRTLEKDAQVVADPKATSVDESAKIIPAKILETDQNGSGKGTATGKKQVGDAAKGKVILYNATTKPITVNSGTTLTTDNGLKFSLDSSVQIASKSASAADPPSRSDSVAATAAAIGPDGNISAGQDLTVNGFGKSEVVAKTDSAFSGGVSKDVTIITSDDQKRLLASLTSDLRKKAQDELQGKLEPGMKILEEALSETIVRQSFSKAVGDQATDFTLNLTVRLKGSAYNENDLKMIVSKLVETNVPSGYTLDLSNTETQADVAKVEKDGRLIFNAKFRAKLIPKVDNDSLKKELVFKTPQEVAERVRQIENVIGSNVEISPSLPTFLQRTPVLSRNISIEVTAK